MSDRRRSRKLISPKSFARRLCIAAGLFLSGCASVNTYVVLLPEEGGAPSALHVGAGGGSVVLDAPYSTATVDTRGNVQAKTVAPNEAKRTFAQALAAQPPQSVSFTLYFDTNSIEVTPASQSTLETLFAEVASRQAAEVQVTGHTDRVGTDADNDRLSLQRADAVRAMLIQRGIKSDFIRAVGRGEREPLVPTPDERPEPQNRRVEVILR